jgi:hypothetical protein
MWSRGLENEPQQPNSTRGITENTKEARYVMLLTAGVSLWSMGVGYVAGMILWHAYRRGWLKA